VQRLNADERGLFLGEFHPEDKILVLLDSGEHKLVGFDLSTHFDENMISLYKWDPERALSAAYFDGEKDCWFVKRFLPEKSNKSVLFISEHEKSRLGVVSFDFHPKLNVIFNRKFKETRELEDVVVDMESFISVKGMKAKGNKLSSLPIKDVELMPRDPEVESQALEVHLASRKANQSAEVQEIPESEPSDESEAEVKQDPTKVELEIVRSEAAAEDNQAPMKVVASVESSGDVLSDDDEGQTSLF
jgi:topoisomerase-4 subunit A